MKTILATSIGWLLLLQAAIHTANFQLLISPSL